MSSAEKPLAPALNMMAPAITSNNQDFYVFYSMNFGNSNYLGMTSMQSQVWSTQNLTGQNGYLTSAPAININSTPAAIAVNGTVYVAYANIYDEIVVISGAGANWKQLPVLSTFNSLKGFRIFTDGSYCYIGYNDNGMMKYTVYNDGWSTAVLLNTSMGVCYESPIALKDNQFTFYFDGNYIRCFYCSSVEVSSIRFRPGDQAGVYSRLLSTPTGYSGCTLKGFIYTNSKSQSYPALMIANPNSTGFIDVFIANGTSPSNKWVTYEFPEGSPTPKFGADVCAVNGGVFVAYPDASGNIQMMFSMDGQNFSTVPISASNGYVQAPACNMVPTLATYNNFVLHMGYANTSPAITDVFWAFCWNNVNLYPLSFKG